jgi:OOP family OmpA-OmpF porin
MTKKFLIIVVFLITASITAQNMVKNPSFEKAHKGPLTYGEFHNNVLHWSSPNLGTPDYFSTRSRGMNARNYRGNQDPKTGDCYAGIYLFAVKNGNSYREYLQVELQEALQKNVTYKVSYHISLAEFSSHSIDSVHTLFTEKRTGGLKNESTLFGKKHVGPKLKDGVIELDTIKSNTFHKQTYYLDNGPQLMYDWLKVEFSYTASGFEKFMVIGNLNKNENTKIAQHRAIEQRAFAYYYIDDVSIIEDSLVPILEEQIIFQPETTYAFKNVLFDFDKTDLLDISIEELDKLLLHLNENPNLKIEIYGHTDNVGLDMRNKELSQQRAEAVSQYLIKKGLDTKRITWFGFGADAPITSNDTKENRAINRRVEFKLISK